MKLGDLLDTLGSDQLRAEYLARDGVAAVGEVVIHDAAEPPERGQLILVAGIDATDYVVERLLVRAADAGASALVLRDSDRPGPVAQAREQGISLLRARPGLGWVRLVELLETLLSATTADPEAQSERLAPSSVHGLADAIAVMVGGSVVLYDRAHRVVAYSVQGYEIDSVRRDTILGRQTPESWVDRFTADRSAYRTYRHPGQVVRVDGYPGLRTRLRVAVSFDDEVLGEISVAEGRHPLGPEAEPALLRAADLAVPFLLRHRLVEDTDRAARARMLRGLMYGDAAPSAHVVAELGLRGRSGYAVAGFAAGATATGMSGVVGERIVHLLSLQMDGIDPATAVVACDEVYYALVPVTGAAAAERLGPRITPGLRQLERMGVSMVAAVGPWVSGLAELPGSRRSVDDLLSIVRRDPARWAGRVATTTELWPDLVLLPVEAALATSDDRLMPSMPLQRMLTHDAEQGTGYVRTLAVYLEEFGSISSAAKRLVLHPNTLRHRLQRIVEISGLDLSDPTQRLAVAVQVRALGASGG